MTDVLPIGSLVKLYKEEKTKIMIIGYTPIDYRNSTIYHYSGVHYPRGVTDNGPIYLFYTKDIKEVIYRGYTNSATEEVFPILEKILQIDYEKPEDNKYN